MIAELINQHVRGLQARNEELEVRLHALESKNADLEETAARYRAERDQALQVGRYSRDPEKAEVLARLFALQDKVNDDSFRGQLQALRHRVYDIHADLLDQRDRREAELDDHPQLPLYDQGDHR